MRFNYLGFCDEEMPCYIWNREFTNTEQEKYYRVLIMGDSQANAAYMPEVLSDDTFNMAMTASSPVENYYVLRDYLEHNEAPEVIFLSYHDKHMPRSSYYIPKIMPSQRLSMAQMMKISYDGWKYQDSSFYYSGIYSDIIATELYFPSKYIVSFIEGKANSSKDENLAMGDNIQQHLGRYVGVGKQEFETVQYFTYDEFKSSPMNYDYLCKFIELCDEEGIELHLVKTPLPDNTIFTDEFYNQINTFYEELLAKYPQITFDWEEQIYGGRFFADETHLNNSGAYIFSSYIKRTYPDVFPDESESETQMMSFDESIKCENVLEDLYNLLDNRNYSLVLIGQRHVVHQLMERYGNDRGYTLQETDYENVYISSPLKYESDGIGILPEGASYIIKVGEEDERWDTQYTDGEIKMAVIDNTNSQLVTYFRILYIDDSAGFSAHMER